MDMLVLRGSFNGFEEEEEDDDATVLGGSARKGKPRYSTCAMLQGKLVLLPARSFPLLVTMTVLDFFF